MGMRIRSGGCTLFIFLYHLVWTALIVLCIPMLPLLRKKGFAQRLALGLPRDSLSGCNIWIHALSVGEVVSALPLVETLRQRFPGKDIVFTVTTSRGMAIARKELDGKVKALLTMPIDFWWCVRRIVRYVNPSVFILVETDIWPGLIDCLMRKGIKSILVNGRVSPRTLRTYRRCPLFTRKMFQPLELCLMQSNLDRERLLQAGIDRHEKVIVVGNIKFDRVWIPMSQKERHEWLNFLSMKSEDLIWVAGSTHRGEEEIVLGVFKRLRASFPALRLILAPREIDRVHEIFTEAQDAGLKVALRTEIPDKKATYDVLILNTLGELGRIYGLGEVSFVGGSLVPVGGHNLLEPAGFGCPVLFGPYVHNFVLMSELLVKAGGGWQVHDGEELHKAMMMLLADTGMRAETGRLAKEFVVKNQGALERVVSYIVPE